MILLKQKYGKIWPFLVVDIYHFANFYQLSIIHLIKKMKPWNLGITGY